MGSPEKMPGDDFPDEEREDERSPDGFDYEAVLKESFHNRIPIEAYVGCRIKFFRPPEHELNDECHQGRKCCQEDSQIPPLKPRVREKCDSYRGIDGQ